MKTISVLFVFILSLASPIVSAQLPENLSAIFKYNRVIIPKYTVDSTFTQKDVIGQRIVYTSTDSFKVSAYIISPETQAANRPFVLFNHWGEGNKDEFLQQAILLSHNGFVCILIDGPWLCPNSPIKSFKNQGYEMYRQYVMNARTAIDLAQQHLKINEDKIFCVGHSFGCNTAAVLSAIDQRIDYFVFMAGVYSTTQNISDSQFPDFVQWRTENPQQFKDWVTKMKPLDAQNYLPYKTAPCLIQIANKDEYLTDAENDTFIRLTPVPKEVKIYDAGHAFNKQAEEDRTNWILQK